MSLEQFIGHKVRLWEPELVTHYASLMPDLDERALREGLRIVEVRGGTSACFPARLENDRYAMIETGIEELGESGQLFIGRSDNHRVMHAFWTAQDMPVQAKFERGRLFWDIPEVGRLLMYYNEKKEDMNYEPDQVSFQDRSYLGTLAISGETFSVQQLLLENRLYYGYEAFASALDAAYDRSRAETEQPFATRKFSLLEILPHLPRLAKGCELWFNFIARNPANGKYEKFGPYYPDGHRDPQGRY